MINEERDKLRKAFNIAFDLAWDNALDARDCVGSEELAEAMKEQHDALDLASDWINQQLGQR